MKFAVILFIGVLLSFPVFAETWMVGDDGQIYEADENAAYDSSGQTEALRSAEDQRIAEATLKSLAASLGGLPEPPALKNAVIALPPEPQKNKSTEPPVKIRD